MMRRLWVRSGYGKLEIESLYFIFCVILFLDLFQFCYDGTPGAVAACLLSPKYHFLLGKKRKARDGWRKALKRLKDFRLESFGSVKKGEREKYNVKVGMWEISSRKKKRYIVN